MKKFMEEFKTFVMRGNVLDLAVGVIIGGAFQKIITSMVNDIIMPVITLITGGVNFTEWFISLDGNTYATLEDAQKAGAATLNYGVFITEVINFLIIAFVIFMIVRTVNKISEAAKPKEEEVPAAPTTKKCPHCCSEIAIEATRCPNCTSVLETE